MGPKHPVAKYLRVLFRDVELDEVLEVDTEEWSARIIDPPLRVCDKNKRLHQSYCGECHKYRDKPHIAVTVVPGIRLALKENAPWWAKLWLASLRKPNEHPIPEATNDIPNTASEPSAKVGARGEEASTS